MKRIASKKSVSVVCAVIALGAVAALPALSQAPAPSGPPKPAPEIAQLAFFAGEWSCKGKAEASPMGPEHPTQVTVHISKEMGGFWYAGRYSEKKTAANPYPMDFHFMQGYDSTAKAFSMDCFDAFGEHCHQTSAGWQDGKLVYTGEMAGNGPATPIRDTFIKKGDAALEHSAEIQAEGKWVMIDHESCTRAKK
ncbi:MAG: DUF1579 family protein [Thermoanaerobaculia bacterium]